jgi:tRNA pseudouridine55 synthase
MFSALKRDGVPLYRLARRGVEVDRAERDIVVHALELRLAEPSAIDFTVRCSKGTYVRVLAADIGRALGTVAHLERLRRTAVGVFRVADAVTPERLRAEPAERWPLIPVAEAVAGLARIPLGPEAVAALRHGRQAVLRELGPGAPGSAALVVEAGGAVVGIVEMAEDGWRLARLFAAG